MSICVLSVQPVRKKITLTHTADEYVSTCNGLWMGTYSCGEATQVLRDLRELTICYDSTLELLVLFWHLVLRGNGDENSEGDEEPLILHESDDSPWKRFLLRRCFGARRGASFILQLL